MLRILRSACLVALVGLLSSSFGEEKSVLNDPLGENAALRYYQAFISMPETDPVEDRFTADWRNVPLDEAAVKFIERYRASLKFLHEGAAIARCAWGLNYDLGPAMPMPHLAKARELARIACLDARHAFQSGDQDKAVKAVITVLALARHAGADGLLISKLVDYAIETMVIELGADNVWRLNEATLKALAASFGSLPKEVTLSDAILIEKEVFVGWAIRELKAGGTEVMEALGDLPAEDKAEIHLLSGGTPEGLAKLFEQTGKEYEELAEIMALPLQQFEPRAKEFQQKMEKANPVTRRLTPALGAIRYQEATLKAKLAMLRAAMGVIQGGQDSLKGVSDPLGEGTFEYIGLEDGFELRSKHEVDRKFVALKVKQPAM